MPLLILLRIKVCLPLSTILFNAYLQIKILMSRSKFVYLIRMIKRKINSIRHILKGAVYLDTLVDTTGSGQNSVSGG